MSHVTMMSSREKVLMDQKRTKFWDAFELLKFDQVILGAITTLMLCKTWLDDETHYIADFPLLIPEAFYSFVVIASLLISTYLTGRFLHAYFTGAVMKPKSKMEVIYHLAVAVLLVLSAILFMINSDRVIRGATYHRPNILRIRMATAFLGMINAFFYALGAFFAARQQKSRSEIYA